MNKAQRLVVVVGLIAVAGAVLWTPWAERIQSQYSERPQTVSLGYAFLFNAPDPSGSRSQGVHVQIDRLAVAVMSVGLLACAAFFALGLPRRNESGESHQFFTISRRSWKIASVVAFLLLAAWWGWDAWQNRVERTDSLNGLRLGMSPLEVRYVKGDPSEEIDRPALQGEPPKRSMKYDNWLSVEFRDRGGEWVVESICDSTGAAQLWGLNVGSPETNVGDRLAGWPSKQSFSPDGKSKALSFESLGATVVLTHSRISMLCVSDAPLQFADASGFRFKGFLVQGARGGAQGLWPLGRRKG